MNELLEDLPGEKTLSEISKKRVFMTYLNDDGNLFLLERCDEYFDYPLDYKACEDISNYFGELSKRLEGVNRNE